MTFTIDSELIKNDDVKITTDANGDLAIEHIPTGQTLAVDGTASLADLEAKTSGLSSDGTSANLESVSAEQVHTESRGPSVVVHVKDDGTIVADGPNSELASGDFSSPSDVTAVLQAALDEGGHVLVRRNDSPYTLAVAGQDVEGYDYCLAATSLTVLELETGATVEYPADSSVSPPDVATPIWVPNDTTDFKVTGGGTIDAGYHRTDQPTSYNGNEMGIKIGCRDTSNSIRNIVIEGITCTGAWRHFVEVIGAPDAGPERVRIEDVTFDDGSGDDDVSVSIGSRYVTVRDCWSVNKVREGNWTGASFEAEDGARHVLFEGLWSIDPNHNGVTMGKSHAPDPPCKNHRAVNCTVVTPGKQGYLCTPSGDGQVTESIAFEGCEVIGSTSHGFKLGGDGSHTVRDLSIDITVRGTTGSGTHGLDFNHLGGTIEGLTIKSGTVIRDPNNFGIRFQPASSGAVYKDLTIEGITIDGPSDSIRFLGDGTNYAGNSVVRDNRFILQNGGWAGLKFHESTAPRQYVRTIDNEIVGSSGASEDLSPEVPANPSEGMWYLDDGTNTGSGTAGKRVYLGGAWIDAYTA